MVDVVEIGRVGSSFLTYSASPFVIGPFEGMLAIVLQANAVAVMFSPKLRWSPFPDNTVTSYVLRRSSCLSLAFINSDFQLHRSTRSFRTPCLRNKPLRERIPCKHRGIPGLSELLSVYRKKLVRTCSASTDGNGTRPVVIEENGRSVQRKTDLQVVLVSPQIPGNTGCIARSCAAAAVGLHLVEPLGFEINSAKLKRAGLDYWPYVVVKVHSSWGEFFKYFLEEEGDKRLLAFTKKGTQVHTEVKYRKGDWLMFGSETDGIPEEALEKCRTHKYGGGTVRIPIDETYVRCLNLSVAAGIGVYEALRQVGFSEDMLDTSNRQAGMDSVKEDIFV
ncbi:hypothetical protein R1sor_003953 [Riccia sorocarpa]|uniref:tRNA/rRNA methyltransferase SpoU type domain-containing protein n=1 Tax=Riccia sorocarpa TaxID=122646 RepID=A0ABD3H747_9MARC